MTEIDHDTMVQIPTTSLVAELQRRAAAHERAMHGNVNARRDLGTPLLARANEQLAAALGSVLALEALAKDPKPIRPPGG